MSKGKIEAVKYTKEQLYNSKKYEYQRDLISCLLDNDMEYTTEEVDKIIKDFNNKEVK